MKFKDFLRESLYNDDDHDNNDDYDHNRLSDADKALYNYTLNPMHIYEVYEEFDELLSLYANKKSMTVYRGLNFETKEKYDKFISNIQDGNINIKNISSWTPHKKTAEQFAVTRPSYMEFMDSENMKLISTARKNHERVVGYRGVILETSIKAGVGIDVTRSKFAKESEVILPSGSYKISVTEVLKNSDRFSEFSSLKDAIESAIKEHNDSNTSLLDHIIKFHHEKFTDEEKSLLGKYFLVNAEVSGGIDVEDPNPKSYWRDNKEGTINIYMTDDHIASSYKHIFLQDDIEKYYKKYASVLSKLYKDLKAASDRLPEANVINRSNASFKNIISHTGQDDLYRKINAIIGKKLVKLTGDDVTKNINKLSGKEQRDAIDKLQKDLLKALSSF